MKMLLTVVRWHFLLVEDYSVRFNSYTVLDAMM